MFGRRKMLQQPEISNNLCSTFGKGHAGILVTLEWVKSSGIELTEKYHKSNFIPHNISKVNGVVCNANSTFLTDKSYN